MVEYINDNELKLAIIIRNKYRTDGIHFFTDKFDSQQLGYMNRPAGYEILPHKHNIVEREIRLTQEVLFIKSGKVRVDFYGNEQNYIKSTLLIEGDVILLSEGGHGFKIIQDAEIIEVKQGPYCGEIDKIKFNSITENKIKYI